MKRKITSAKFFRNAESEADHASIALANLKSMIAQAIHRTPNGFFSMKKNTKDYTVEELMEIAVKCKAEIEIIIPDA